MGTVISILAMLLMLSILTIVHEFGHYIVGRLFKVKILEFSVFMGPKIFSHTSKKTGIKYSLRWLPIGGYCAFEGEEEEQSADSFSAKPWYVRACILVAGAFMNILLALIIIVIIFTSAGYSTTKVSRVEEGYIADVMNLEAGDKILSYDGKKLFSADDYSIFHEYDTDNEIEFLVRKKDGSKERYLIKVKYEIDEEKGTGTVERRLYPLKTGKKDEKKNINEDEYSGMIRMSYEGKGDIKLRSEYPDGRIKTKCYEYVTDENGKITKSNVTLTEYFEGEQIKAETSEVSPEEILAASSGLTKIGFSFDYKDKGNINFFEAIGESFKYLFTLTRSIYYSIYWIITGTVGFDAVMGPVGLTSVVSTVVTADASFTAKFLSLLNMVALIGVNLGVFNLLPFPALDGGKLFLILIELIRGGKKIDPEKEGIISIVGFAVLIILAILIAGKDIIALIKG